MELEYTGKHAPSRGYVALASADNATIWSAPASTRELVVIATGVRVPTIGPTLDTKVDVQVYRDNGVPRKFLLTAWCIWSVPEQSQTRLRPARVRLQKAQ